MRLVNLPGVAGGIIEDVRIAGSIAGAMRDLHAHRAITGAGDYGAWTVWRDDGGQFRCEFNRHRVTVNEATFATYSAVRKWLVEWFPRTSQEGGTA